MPCPCCGGACCYPEMEACTELGDPCGGEGDPACPEGFTCVGGICERLSVTPIGTCPGTVQGPIAASCVDGLTQSACETGGGTYHPGQTCEQICCGPCDEENPCPEGCSCVDGVCVASCCCIDGEVVGGYTQETCEECGTVNTCYEELYLEDPEEACPEGWSGGEGYCYRTTSPASCGECSGYCDSSQVGACGDWQDCTSVTPAECESGNICLTTDTVASSLPAAAPCGQLNFGFFNPTYDLSLQANGSYAYSASGASFTISRQCSRWKLVASGFGSLPPDVTAYGTVSITADCGPVEEDVCGPSAGLTCTGTAYWTASGCSGAQNASGSMAYSASTVDGAC